MPFDDTMEWIRHQHARAARPPKIGHKAG
jgi:hypothetical protein